jgi:hypothetical protein
MKEKKHIDRLFQESFKDFEAAPSDAVWQNIEAKLNQNKKKRRVIPIWWRYASVAALLLLLLTIGSVYFKSDNSIPENKIVNSKEDSPETLIKENNSSDFNKTTTDVNNPEKNNSENTNKNITPQNTNKSFQSNIANKNISEDSSLKTNNLSEEKQPQTTKKPLLVNEKNAVANSSEETKNKMLPEGQSIAETAKTNEVANSNKPDTSVIADTNSEEKNPLIDTTKNNTVSIEEAIAETNTKDIKNDLTRWTIATNAAPVYFNSLGKGSSLDAQFNNNSKNGEVTLSYGVSASYSINNKLSIRSGINKVNLGYNTNNVVVFQALGSRNSSALKNINSDNTSGNLSLISGENLSAQRSDTFTKTSNTSINQSLGYIEIPLEIEYALIDKKLGFNVIGGFSSFILSSNELFSEFGGNRMRIGEATNINKVSYSANFGLGLSYKLTKKLDLNLEPLFKYQINTFNNTSGNFKPYFIGVYTGIGFKF